MKSLQPFGSCPNLESRHHHSILKAHIQHFDVIYSYRLKTLMRPYDVALIYAAYAKWGKIQMSFSRE